MDLPTVTPLIKEFPITTNKLLGGGYGARSGLLAGWGDRSV